jgi:hypothetical protein
MAVTTPEPLVRKTETTVVGVGVGVGGGIGGLTAALALAQADWQM